MKEKTYVFVDCPVKDVVILESLTDKKVTEQLAEVRVVGLVIETERTNIVEVDRKLLREAAAENVG
jgi:hypothetical protein